MSLIRKQDQVIRMQGVLADGTADGEYFTPEVISFTASPVQSANVREFVAGSDYNLRNREVYETHYEFDGSVEANPQTILTFIYWAMTSVGDTGNPNPTHPQQLQSNGVSAVGGTDGVHLLNISVSEGGNIQTLEQCIFTSITIEGLADGDDQSMVINFSGIAKNMTTATGSLTYEPLKTFLLSDDTVAVLTKPYSMKDLLQDHTGSDANSIDLQVEQIAFEIERPVGIHYIAGGSTLSGINFIPENQSVRCAITAAYTKSSYDDIKNLYDNNSTLRWRFAFKNNNRPNDFYFNGNQVSVTELTPVADVATEGYREFSFTIEHFDKIVTDPILRTVYFSSLSHLGAFPYQKISTAY